MRFWMLKCLVLQMVMLNHALLKLEYANPDDLVFDTLSFAQCLAECNDYHGYFKLIKCNAECNLLSKSPKNGTCPDPGSISMTDLPFEPECKYDVDCSDHYKCCKPHMFRNCVEPTFHDPATFPVPPYDIELVDDYRGEAYVHWKLDKVPLQDDTLFVMESRNHFGVFFNESQMSEYKSQPFSMQIWKSASDENFNLISRKVQLKAGRTYQFRVASVNRFGSHGFVQSRPFQLRRDPFPPKKVRNVTLGRWFTYNQQTFCRQFGWRTVRSDLKIHKVKLVWYPLGNNATGDNTTDHWTVSVNPKRVNYEIRNFKPNTRYEVQIIVVCHFDNIRYYSPPVYVEFTTPRSFDFIQVKSLKHQKNQPKWKPLHATNNEYKVKY